MRAFDHPWVTQDGALLELVFPPSPPDEGLHSYVAAARAFYGHGDAEPIAWVVDGTDVAKSTSGQRRILAELLKEQEETLAARCVAMAIVVPNALLRGTVQAIFWIAPPKYPHKLFGDVEAARAWASEQLSARAA